MTVYDPADRPAIEVHIDDQWHPGELRAWQHRDDGWWANVSYSVGGQTYLATVPAARVREVEG